VRRLSWQTSRNDRSPDRADEHGAPVKLGYVPALDGLRAIAIIGVLADHTGYGVFHDGGFGVDVFFVLSGFLITTLLLEEFEGTGGFSLSLFWWRRGGRLLPALAVVCAFVAVTFSVYRPTDWQKTLYGVGASALYLSAWVRAFNLSSLGWMGHTWTLAVEEWFYILWPIAAVLALRRNRLGLFVASLASVAVAYRLVSEHTFSSAYLINAPDQQANLLLIGCALAVLLLRRRELLSPSVAVPSAWIALAMLAVLLGGLAGERTTHGLRFYSGEITLIGIATAVVITATLLAPASLIARGLGVRPAVWVGKRSYGIYLWHYPLMGLATPVHTYTGVTLLASRLVVIVSSFVAAAGSYRWIERPCIRAVRRREQAVRAARRRSEVIPAAR